MTFFVIQFSGREKMARLRIAPVEQESEDPYLLLFLAMIDQARRDMAFPVICKGHTSSNHPTKAQQETARQFLQELRESACRRVDRRGC
jgi:hypothetical protein